MEGINICGYCGVTRSYRHMKKLKQPEKMSSLDLMIRRFNLSQNMLARRLGKTRGALSKWRHNYDGMIPPSSWGDCARAAREDGIPLTLDELENGGYP